MTDTTERPLSPHLSIWKWGPHMLVSILHRVTGGALAVAGLAILTWWLWALADGAESYDAFLAAMAHPVGIFVMLGLTWSFWQHFLSGLRHMVLDTGAGFELRINRFFSVMTVVTAMFLTALTWAFVTGVLG